MHFLEAWGQPSTTRYTGKGLENHEGFVLTDGLGVTKSCAQGGVVVEIRQVWTTTLFKPEGGANAQHHLLEDQV